MAFRQIGSAFRCPKLNVYFQFFLGEPSKDDVGSFCWLIILPCLEGDGKTENFDCHIPLENAFQVRICESGYIGLFPDSRQLCLLGTPLELRVNGVWFRTMNNEGFRIRIRRDGKTFTFTGKLSPQT